MAQRDGQRRKRSEKFPIEQWRDVIQATGDGAGRYTADSACSKSCKGPRKDSVV